MRYPTFIIFVCLPFIAYAQQPQLPTAQQYIQSESARDYQERLGFRSQIAGLLDQVHALQTENESLKKPKAAAAAPGGQSEPVVDGSCEAELSKAKHALILKSTMESADDDKVKKRESKLQEEAYTLRKWQADCAADFDACKAKWEQDHPKPAEPAKP